MKTSSHDARTPDDSRPPREQGKVNLLASELRRRVLLGDATELENFGLVDEKTSFFLDTTELASINKYVVSWPMHYAVMCPLKRDLT